MLNIEHLQLSSMEQVDSYVNQLNKLANELDKEISKFNVD